MAEDVFLVRTYKALRTAMKARRAALSAAERVRCAQAIARHLFEAKVLDGARRIAGYWAINGELPLNAVVARIHAPARSEEYTSELQSLMRISYAVFCFKQNKRAELAQHITS